VATGNVTDGVSHREHGQSESEGYTQQPNPNIRKRSRKHGTAATTENQPKGPYKLRC
jgi:hypothetical protein